jgi:hypothetical protein
MNKKIILSQLPSYLVSLWSFYVLIGVLSSENPPFWKVFCSSVGFVMLFSMTLFFSITIYKRGLYKKTNE